MGDAVKKKMDTPFRVLAIVALTTARLATAGPTYPGDSIYQVHATLTDQAGHSVTLDRYAGQPTIVSMFYASCPHVCPMLVGSVKRLQQELPLAERHRLRVLFVSVDPSDTPEALSAVLTKQGVAVEDRGRHLSQRPSRRRRGAVARRLRDVLPNQVVRRVHQPARLLAVRRDD